MSPIKMLIGIFAMMVALSCNTKKATPTEPGKSRFLSIEFISFGAGTDYQSRERVDAAIANFEKQYGAKVPLAIRPWGREGESTYCLTLTSLPSRKGDELVKAVKTAANGSERVRVEESEKCE